MIHDLGTSEEKFWYKYVCPRCGLAAIEKQQVARCSRCACKLESEGPYYRCPGDGCAFVEDCDEEGS